MVIGDPGKGYSLIVRSILGPLFELVKMTCGTILIFWNDFGGLFFCCPEFHQESPGFFPLNLDLFYKVICPSNRR